MKFLLVIGAQKAGTTSLFHYLRRHPRISASEVKEVNFFTVHHEKGMEWYSGLFDAGAELSLDVSPLYLHDAAAAARIGQSLPEARLVCLIRDPIERAVSNYSFNVARGLQDPGESFAASVRSDRGRRRYLDKGLYAAQLDRYADFFSAGRLLVVDFDRLRLKPDEVVAEVCAHAGLAPEPLERASYKIHNKTAAVGGLSAQIIYRTSALRRRYSAQFERLPGWVQRGLRDIRARAARTVGKERAPEVVIDRATEAFLTDYFAKDVQRLVRDYPIAPAWAERYLERSPR